MHGHRSAHAWKARFNSFWMLQLLPICSDTFMELVLHVLQLQLPYSWSDQYSRIELESEMQRWRTQDLQSACVLLSSGWSKPRSAWLYESVYPDSWNTDSQLIIAFVGLVRLLIYLISPCRVNSTEPTEFDFAVHIQQTGLLQLLIRLVQVYWATIARWLAWSLTTVCSTVHQCTHWECL